MTKGTMADRFARIDSMVGVWGFRARHITGGEGGEDWEVTFRLELPERYARQAHHVMAATETELIAYLGRALPMIAAEEWKSYALLLEGELADLKRGR